MEYGFWKKIAAACAAEKRPIFVLAPMADVTDAAFRRIITKYGKPDVLWTEFVSADGLCSPGRKVLIRDLEFSRKEKPIVAQLFTSKPEKMREAAALCQKMGFHGIDINMGCPDKSIEKQGCGAGMIKSPEAARAVIRAAKEGAPKLPISVKTRIGYNKNEIATWIPEILSEGVAALTIHCRTRKEMSNVPARWEHIREVTALRDQLAPDTLIIGNGDIRDIADGRAKAAEFGADGVMLGRAIFGNPWLFAELHAKPGKDGIRRVAPPTVAERLSVMVEHTKLYEKLLGDIKSFAIMKKHYKAYVSGFDFAKELRMRLMEATDSKEVGKVVKRFLKDGSIEPSNLHIHTAQG